MCLTRKNQTNKKKYKKKFIRNQCQITAILEMRYMNVGFVKNTCTSNDIKIFCDGCEKFYCCHIAGSCLGESCTYTLASGLTHSSRYCLNCVNLKNSINTKFKGDRCICKKCEPSFTK